MINERMLQVVSNRRPPILYDPIEYVLSGTGKRIRPSLLLLACNAVGGKIEAGLDAAVAVELLHNFTLVHDDIMDEDGMRRGRPTVHEKWNVSISLLAGDGLLALAYQALLKTRTSNLQQIVDIFTKGLVEVCEGQALDLDFETRKSVELAGYLEMIGKKTACLLTVSAKIGALIGGGSEMEVDALGKFAFNLGLAFQIQDDVLDIMSDETTIGKSYGSDVQKRKQTYLLIHALAYADETDREELSGLLNRTVISRADVLAVKEIFQKAGSVDSAKSAVANYIYDARENLRQLRNTFERDCLLSFLETISKRNA